MTNNVGHHFTYTFTRYMAEFVPRTLQPFERTSRVPAALGARKKKTLREWPRKIFVRGVSNCEMSKFMLQNKQRKECHRRTFWRHGFWREIQGKKKVLITIIIIQRGSDSYLWTTCKSKVYIKSNLFRNIKILHVCIWIKKNVWHFRRDDEKIISYAFLYSCKFKELSVYFQQSLYPVIFFRHSSWSFFLIVLPNLIS